MLSRQDKFLDVFTLHRLFHTYSLFFCSYYGVVFLEFLLVKLLTPWSVSYLTFLCFHLWKSDLEQIRNLIPGNDGSYTTQILLLVICLSSLSYLWLFIDIKM